MRPAIANIHHLHNEQDAALAFVRQHMGEHLAPEDHLLLTRTADMLQDRFHCRRQTALDLAAKAMAAVECSAEPYNRYWVDMSQSTSTCIFLRSAKPGEPTRVLSVRDLLRAAELLRH